MIGSSYPGSCLGTHCLGGSCLATTVPGQVLGTRGSVMTRSRYRFGEDHYPHFITATVVAWLPVFSYPCFVEVILNSCGKKEGVPR